jgi:hypothetical protein
LQVNSIKELIAFGKARPLQLLYGSAGVGTTPHLAVELFNSMADLKMVHVVNGNRTLIQISVDRKSNFDTPPSRGIACSDSPFLSERRNDSGLSLVA